MDKVGEEWRKEIDEKFKDKIPDSIPAVLRRCPQCKQLSLQYDPDTATLHCDKCGFKHTLKRLE